MIDPRLRDRVVLITGANHGIGAATARAFGAQGAKVFLSYYRVPCLYTEHELQQAREVQMGGDRLYRAGQQQSAEPIAQHIRSRGGEACAWETDLGDPLNVPSLFDRCEAELGPVDVLVTNHAHCAEDTFDPERVSDKGAGVRLITSGSIDSHFAVNARACALMVAEYTARHLQRKARWGRIINVSTDAAHCHSANTSYAASKHAIESYSRSAAAELGRYGITVNVVAPGPIQTGYIEADHEAEIAATTPLGRVGEPADVADVIVFLASEQARWITGQLLYVGGGYRMHQ